MKYQTKLYLSFVILVIASIVPPLMWIEWESHRELLDKTHVLTAFAFALVLGLFFAGYLSHTVTKSLHEIQEGVNDIGHGDFRRRLTVHSTDEFGYLAHSINHMTRNLEIHERLKSNFARYVSPHVLQKILESDLPPQLKGERKKVTVLFSDIRGFTRLAEPMPPEDVVLLLNEYLRLMINVVFKYSGTVDKFIGDGLMVLFGAPLDDEKQEENAVEAALAMQRALSQLTQKLEIGIGIHTGQAVVGNIGSHKRLEYTAIGDTVNVASRLEQATKTYGANILVSESTMKALNGRYQAEKMGPISLPGREQLIGVFKVKAV